MGKSLRSKWGILATAVALVVGLATIPAIGSHLPNDSGTLRLHLGSDATYFRYTPAAGPTQTQNIAAPVRCEASITGPLAAVSGSNRGPGLVSYGLGIKSGGAQGTPCSRVDATENMAVELVGVPLAASAAFDLELKGDAKITVAVYLNGSLLEDFEVRSGGSIVAGQGVDGSGTEPYTAAATTDDPATTVDESIANCRNQSDSGPDAGARDNCRLSIDPSLPFDEVRFTPSVGEMSLEGSSDFGNDPTKDTIFYLTSYQGLLDCGDSATDTSGGTDVTITRHQNIDDPATAADESLIPCTPKAYSLEAVDADPPAEDTVTFELSDPAQVALYRADLTFDRPLAGLFDAQLFYDPNGSDGYDDFVEMPACTGDPGLKTDAVQDETVIPTGDQGCIVSVLQNYDGTTTWDVLFYGDWRFK